MSDALNALCVKLGYRFKNIDLLKLALTHRSVSGIHNNERLEFLGDSVLNLAITQALYKQFNQAREGQLSRLRSGLVSGESLSVLAREFDLGNYLNLGVGELKSGGHRRASILADAMEAVIGAIFLDSDLAQCAQCVRSWFADRLQGLSIELPKDFKTRLQELVQSKKIDLPSYEIVNIAGDAHEQTFELSCYIADLQVRGKGIGTSRRRAEQAAAEDALKQIAQLP